MNLHVRILDSSSYAKKLFALCQAADEENSIVKLPSVVPVFQVDNARENAAVAVDEWHVRYEKTPIAIAGESLSGIVAAKVSLARKTAEAQRKARLAAIALTKARRDEQTSIRKEVEKKYAEEMEVYNHTVNQLQNKALEYNLAQVAQRRRAEKVCDIVKREAHARLNANLGVGLKLHDFALHSTTIHDANLTLDAAEVECGFTYPALIFWFSAFDRAAPMGFMAAFEAARAKCTNMHVLVSIHCTYHQMPYFMKEFNGLFWDHPYIIGSTFESLTIEHEFPYEDRENIHPTHNHGEFAGLNHSVIMTGSTSVVHLNQMQDKMTRDFVGVGYDQMNAIRQRWPGDIHSHVKPGVYEPYCFRANLTGQLHGPRFPVAAAITNYFVWRTDPEKTKTERLRTEQVWIICDTNPLDVIVACNAALLCPVMFLPPNRTEPQHKAAYETDMPRMLTVCSFFFSSEVRSFLTQGMTPFVEFALLCLLCMACARNHLLEPSCFLYTHESDHTKRVVPSDKRIENEMAATGVEMKHINSLRKNNLNERGLFYNKSVKAVPADELPPPPTRPLTGPGPYCSCVNMTAPTSYLHTEAECGTVEHVFTQLERVNAGSDAMGVPAAMNAGKITTYCYFCVEQIDKTGKVFEDPSHESKHFSDEAKGMCHLRYYQSQV